MCCYDLMCDDYLSHNDWWWWLMNDQTDRPEWNKIRITNTIKRACGCHRMKTFSYIFTSVVWFFIWRMKNIYIHCGIVKDVSAVMKSQVSVLIRCKLGIFFVFTFIADPKKTAEFLQHQVDNLLFVWRLGERGDDKTLFRNQNLTKWLFLPKPGPFDYINNIHIICHTLWTICLTRRR